MGSLSANNKGANKSHDKNEKHKVSCFGRWGNQATNQLPHIIPPMGEGSKHRQRQSTLDQRPKAKQVAAP